MIKKAIIFLSITIGLMYATQWFINEGLRLNKEGVYHKYSTLFLAKNNYSALVLGSSRAEMHTDVNLLGSLTGLNTYNAGVSGASTRIAYVVLKSYLLNSQIPKTIFLEIDFHISHVKTDTIFNFSRYFCYLSNPILYSELQKIDSRFLQFKKNPFYSLPHSGINALNPSLRGWFDISASYDTFYEKGFFKNTMNDNYDHFKVSAFTGFIHPEARQYLDSFIVFSRKNNIQLIFTISPVYKQAEFEVLNKPQIIANYKIIAKHNHIPILDLSNDTAISNHKKYFEDNYHMLYSGARIYTKKLGDFYNNIKR